MTERWSRRTLLTSLGALAVAGCTSDEDASGTDPPTGSPSPAVTPTPSASPTDVHTVSGTDRDGTPSSTETDSPESPTETAASIPEGTPTAPASVESDWPVPGADAGRSNAVGATGPTDAVAELWRVSASGLSSPVLGDGTLYVGGDDGTVRAMDATTGASKWTASVGGAAGTPRVVDNTVFVPISGGVVALAPDRGRERWRVETPNRRGLLVAPHGIYWIDESGPTVVALGLADGSERWRTDIADPWQPRVFASDDRVFVSSGPYDNRYWRLDAGDGTQYNDPPRRGADFPAEQCHRAGTVYAVDAFFGNVNAKPVSDAGASWGQGVPPGGEAGGGLVAVGDEHAYYTANVDDEPGLTALATDSGSEEWTAEVTPTILGRPAVADGAVVVPTDDGLRSFDPADGSQQWASGVETGSRVVVADDLVFTTAGSAVIAYRAP